MDDRNQEVFRRYDIRVYTTYKARGAIVLETDKGLKLLKNFGGSIAHVEFEQILKKHLVQQGYRNVDVYMPNLEGELVTQEYGQDKYVLKDWFVGEECNIKEPFDILEATSNLAMLHKRMRGVPVSEEQRLRNVQPNLHQLYEKRNRELKRVRTYIRNKRQKNKFELTYISNFQKFYAQALEASELLSTFSYDEMYQQAVDEVHVCHGNYTYHNVMMLRGTQPASTYPVRGEKETNKREYVYEKKISLSAAEITGKYEYSACTNFDRCNIGIQISDLYHFLRKAMEKNEWDIELGKMMVEQYHKIKPFTLSERKLLYVMLLYPEKFWKVSNFYYNGKKSWVPQRNIQKLLHLQEQFDEKEHFMKQLKCILYENE